MFAYVRSALPRRSLFGLVALLLLPLARLLAQEPVRTLTVEDAIRQARLRNPAFLQTSNDVVDGEWAVREAYGALLPGASVGAGLSYQQGGEPRLFGAYTGSDLGLTSTPDYYYSSYNLSLNYGLSGADLFRIPQAKASRSASLARVRAADFNLSATVTRQYLLVLRAQESVALARQELVRAEENLKLATARVEVGAAIPLDAKQAAVERGRAEVAVLQTESALSTERLRLFELMGVEDPGAVELTSRFAVGTLAETQESLMASALQRHPSVVAYRAQERAAGKGVRMAQSMYLPSLNVSMGWSGYTRRSGSDSYLIDQARNQMSGAQAACVAQNDLYSRLAQPLPPDDCSVFNFTADMERAIRDQNSEFPFNFTKDPLQAQLTISLPIFNGFSRERQVESARLMAEDAMQARRAEELRIRTAVSSAYQLVESSRKSVLLEEKNRELAGEQLELARERYRVGAANFLELKDAETLKARADRAYLDALYGYHEALANLQAASGVTLNPMPE